MNGLSERLRSFLRGLQGIGGAMRGSSRSGLSDARKFAALMLVLTSAGVAFLTARGLFSLLFLIAALPFGCATFLLLTRRGRLVPRFRLELRPESKRRGRLLAATLYFTLLGMSLLVVASRPYEKPLAYYGLITGCTVGLLGHIALLDRRRQVPLALGMIVLHALNVFGSSQLVFPYGIGGADSPTHYTNLIQPILETGHVPGIAGCAFGFDYDPFPGQHILAAATSLLLAIDPLRAYYGMGLIIMTLPVVIVFLMGRLLFGAKVGLLAALLLTGSSYYIYWASHAAPLAYSLPFIVAMMFIAVRSPRRWDPRFLAMNATFGAAIVFTHPYSSMIFAFVLVGLLVGEAIARIRRRAPSWSIAPTSLAFFLVLAVHWIFYSCLMTQALSFANKYVSTITSGALLAPPAVYDALPLSEILINTLGDSILLGAAIVGFFLALSRPRRKRPIAVGSGLTLLALAIIGVLTSLVYLLPNRIYVYLQVLGLVPLAAIAIASSRPAKRKGDGLPERTGRPPIREAMIIALVALFTFQSSASTIAGFESSPFTGGHPYVKLYETPYERQSAEWLCLHVRSADKVHASLSLSGFATNEIQTCLEPRNGTIQGLTVTENGTIDLRPFAPGTVVLFSTYDLEPGFQATITGVGRHGQGVFQRLSSGSTAVFSHFDRVYDNGRVTVFRVPG